MGLDLYQLIRYPLYAGGVLEVILGTAILKQSTSRAMRACAALFFFLACFVLSNAISYTLESQARDYNFFNRASWIGWFMIPACLQFVYYMQDEGSRAARIVGYVLYPFWGVVFALTMFTNLVEPGDPSLIPFVDVDGPLEKPARIIGTLMAIWLFAEIFRAKNRLTGLKKTQLNLFFYGTMFFNAGCILVAGILPLFGAINPAFTAFFSLPWVVIAYYAITREQLFDLRLLVSRALNIAILSILFSALHIVLFKLLSPSLGDSLAILLPLAVIGSILFGTQFSRAVQQWIQRMVLQNKYDYQRVLRESIKAIVTILNQDELLAYLIHSIKKSLGVKSICLALKMEGGRLAQLYGDGALSKAKQDRPLSDEMLEWLRQANHVVVREELESAGLPDKNGMIQAYLAELDAEIVVPLVYKGDLKGVVVLGQKGSREPYVQSDIDLLDLLAGHAAIAIENARLYEEARRTKESFLASEAKFRTLAETAATAIFIHQGGNFIYANHASEIIGGYTADEYLKMNFLSLAHPDYVEMIKNRARERLTGGQPPPQYEFKIIKKNGEERWVLMTAGVTEFEGKSTVIGTLIDITARKQAEEERHRLSLLIENSSDYIAMSDMDGRMLFVNQAGRKLVGLDGEADVRKLTADDFYFPEDLPVLKEKRRRSDWRGEFRLKHFKTGVPIPVEWYIFNVTDEATGKPIARAAVMRDIADLKRAREERERYFQQLQATTQSLRESEAKFRSLAETAPAAIFIHQGGRFLYANEASASMLGYSREEFLAMDFWGVTHPDDKEMIVKRGSGRLTGDRTPERYEFRVVTKSGDVRWVDMTAAVIEYEGKPAVLGNAFDISDRKQGEEERERLNLQLREVLHSFQESESRFRTLAETTTAAIFIHQGQKLVYANSAGETMTGYTREELLQEDFWALIHPDYQELAKEGGQARMLGKQVPQEYEFKFVRKNGEERWAATTAGLIEYGGNPAIIVTLFDITDWKRAEEAKVKFYEESVKQYQERNEEEKRHRLEKEKILMDLHDGIGGITTNISILFGAADENQEGRTSKKSPFILSKHLTGGVT